MPFSDSESLGSKWVILMHLLTLDQSTVNIVFFNLEVTPLLWHQGYMHNFSYWKILGKIKLQKFLQIKKKKS